VPHTNEGVQTRPAGLHRVKFIMRSLCRVWIPQQYEI